MKSIPCLTRFRRRLTTPWVAGPLVTTLLLPLLFGSAWLALRVTGDAAFGRLPTREALDYGRGLRGGVAPLRGGFIQNVLGNLIEVGAPPGRDVIRQRARPSAPAAEPGFGARTIVDHPPTNDRISAARSIDSIPFTARTDTTEAARTSEDPGACGSVGGTVWYRYRAPRDVLLAAQTFGTDHAVVLGVFRETTQGLALERCDEDRSGNAFVAFRGVESTTYYFQVAAPVEGGRLVFTLDPDGSFVQASVGRSGEPMNSDNAYWPSISADGRYVAFATWATNLVAGDENAGPCTNAIGDQPLWRSCTQVYLRDLQTGVTERVSRGPSGERGNATSYSPFVSGDGRYVVFESFATNLVPGADASSSSVYVFDRSTRKIDAIPTGRDVGGGEPVGAHPSITDDGRFVAFHTFSPLVEGDTNLCADVFVYDRRSRTYERASVDHLGREAPLTPQISPEPGAGVAGVYAAASAAMNPYISPDGRFVVFRSDAPLVPHDRNTHWDTYVRDRNTGTTELISVTSSGEQPNGSSYRQISALPTISRDGRYVAFASAASNLVDGDGDTFIDVFVRDRVARRTLMVSRDLASTDRRVHVPAYVSISGDGRFVGFESNPLALDGVLLPKDAAYELADVYRHDLRTHTTTVVTQSVDGDGWGTYSAISRDGRSVVFMSGSEAFGKTACTPGDHHPGRCWQLFVYRAPRIR